MPDFGWSATVLTSRPRWYFAFDRKMYEEIRNKTDIHRIPSLDHFHLPFFEKLFLSPKKEKLSNFGKSRSFAFPDPEIGWVPFCADYAVRLCGKIKFDAVMCSVPPFSSALAGLLVSKRCGLPLVVDFRDPWIDEKLFPSATKCHAKFNLELEKSVIRNSSLVITINEKIRNSIFERHGKKNTAVISHGYDPDDFPEMVPLIRETFTVCHMGSLWRGRKPDVLLRALDLLRCENIKAVFIGKNSDSALKTAEEKGLKVKIESLGYLSHKDAILEAMKSDVLWFYISPAEGDAVSTGKLFDYLGTGLPIIASIPKNTDAAEVLRKTGAGDVVSPDDHETLSEKIKDLIKKRSRGQLNSLRSYPDYERKNLTGSLCAELDKIRDESF